MTRLRDVVNAILYLLRSGCCPDFLPRSTVQRSFAHWRDSGLWASINRHLLMAVRQAERRNASPSAGVVDFRNLPVPATPGAWLRHGGVHAAGRKDIHLTSKFSDLGLATSNQRALKSRGHVIPSQSRPVQFPNFTSVKTRWAFPRPAPAKPQPAPCPAAVWKNWRTPAPLLAKRCTRFSRIRCEPLTSLRLADIGKVSPEGVLVFQSWQAI